MRAPLAAAACLALCLAADAGETLTLRHRFRKGETATFRRTTNKTLRRILPGLLHIDRSTLTVTLETTVLDVDAGGVALLGVRFAAIEFTRNDGEKTVRYRSSRPARTVPLEVRPFAALAGARIALEALPAGGLRHVRGVKVLVAKARETLGMKEGPAWDYVRDALRRQLSEPGLREMLDGLIAPYPPEPVAIDDTWSHREDLGGYSPVILETTWRLASRREGTARIAVHGTFAPHPTKATEERAVVRIAWHIKGTMKATLDVQETTGRLVTMAQTRSLSGTLSTTALRGDGATQSCPIEVASETVLERLPPEPARDAAQP